jgi:sugar/nucleoside kinase (ribokinase family)
MAHDLDVLGFGSISIDEIFYVDRPLTAGKGRIINRLTAHGGNIATALVAIARLGGRAGWIGWLSDQPPHDLSGLELEREGVDISFAPRRPDAKAIQAFVNVGSDGDRFIAYDNVVPLGTSEDFSEDVLQHAKVLMIDGYAAHSSVAVVAAARKLGLSVVADIEWTLGAATDTLIGLADHLVLPLVFAQNHSGAKSPAEILPKLWSKERAAVVVTDGERGSYVLQRGDAAPLHVPAYRVKAVDTTGAGDCFHGAYALALTKGKEPLACVLYATAASAIAVTGQGGRGSLPTHADVLRKMAGDDAPQPVPLRPST